MSRSEARKPEFDARLEYVRGLLEGGELSDDERRDRTLAELASVVGGLAAEVQELRREVASLRAEDSAGAAGPRVTALCCPLCRAEVGAGALAKGLGPVEAPCPRCGTVLIFE